MAFRARPHVPGATSSGTGGRDWSPSASIPVEWSRPTHVESPERGPALSTTTFTADAAAALGGPAWLARRRSEAWERFEATALPSETEEIWRYSGIDAFDLDAFDAAGAAEAGTGPGDPVAVATGWLPDGAVVVVTDNGLVRTIRRPAEVVGLEVAPASQAGGAEELLGGLSPARDAFGELHDAFLVDPVVVDVAPKTTLAHPVVVLHLVDAARGRGGRGPGVFPHTVVRLGTSAEASVVEVFLDAAATGPLGTGGWGPGAPAALVVPVAELDLGDDAHLAYVNLQLLGPTAWQVGTQASRLGRDAGLRSFTASFGGRYARVRTDSDLTGTAGRTALLAAYLGVGDQVLDFRTLQDHHAPRTESELLFTGAVADTARSVYSGLIRIRHGARGSDAFQTNHNLVLSEGAHADSVPNLDISENDVRCSHASTVGPIDPEQRYYLESRGLRPATAERLIVSGFFADVARRAPVAGVADWMEAVVAARLTGRVGSVAGTVSGEPPGVGGAEPGRRLEPGTRA